MPLWWHIGNVLVQALFFVEILLVPWFIWRVQLAILRWMHVGLYNTTAEEAAKEYPINPLKYTSISDMIWLAGYAWSHFVWAIRYVIWLIREKVRK